jgi:hypothetical protein
MLLSLLLVGPYACFFDFLKLQKCSFSVKKNCT